MFSNEFARRYADQGITSNGLNPGPCYLRLSRQAIFLIHLSGSGNLETELQRHAWWLFRLFTVRVIILATQRIGPSPLAHLGLAETPSSSRCFDSAVGRGLSRDEGL